MKKSIKITSIVLAILLSMGLFAGCKKTDGDASGAQQQTFNYSEGLNEKGHFKDVAAKDIVKLPTYKGMEMPKDISVAKKEDVQSQIDSILEQYVTYKEIKDRAVKNDDTLNIDYVGSVDGKEFEGGTTNGKGTTVTIGVTQYIDGFLDQLVGHKPGETFDINVKFPKDYTSTDLADKDAVFKITINYIQGDKIYPELNDEFVKTNFTKLQLETVTALKEKIASDIIATQEQEFIWNKLAEGTSCENIPESVSKYQKDTLVDYQTAVAAQYGMELTQYLAAMGIESVDAFLEQVKDSINAASKDMLMVQAIAEIESFEVDQAFIDKNFTADNYTAVKEKYGDPYVKMVLLQKKVFDFVKENAVRV